MMTIELDEKTYILGFWFAETQSGHTNIICFYKNDNEEWTVKTQIILKKDDNIFQNEEEKIWYDTKISHPDYPVTEDVILEKMAALQETFKQAGFFTDSIIVQGDLVKLFELAKGKPWFNIIER
jgi:hypothetical protein